MAISFKYKVNPFKKDAKIKTPCIPITLRGNNGTPIDVIALLDSGADISAIPQGLAEFLNLDLNGEKDKAEGVGGEVDVINTKLNVQLKKGHEDYNFNIPVQVILGKDKIPPLLGRNSFFDKFIISFDNKKEKVTLKRNFKRKY